MTSSPQYANASYGVSALPGTKKEPKGSFFSYSISDEALVTPTHNPHLKI